MGRPPVRASSPTSLGPSLPLVSGIASRCTCGIPHATKPMGSSSGGSRVEYRTCTSMRCHSPRAMTVLVMHVRYSTRDQADGILKWWVDGVLNGVYADLKMTQDGGFDHVSFSPTFGGNERDRKRQTDYYWRIPSAWSRVEY